MEMFFKILFLKKYSFELPGTRNCIDRLGHFEKLSYLSLMARVKC